MLVDDILKADEAFIASANRDLIPVTSINGKKITVEQLYVGDEITIGGNVILKVVLV